MTSAVGLVIGGTTRSTSVEGAAEKRIRYSTSKRVARVYIIPFIPVKVTIALDHRFSRTPDGSVWTRTFFGPSFWDRYLGVFDRVEIVGRVREVKAPENGWQRVDNRRVSVVGIPNYIGPWQFLIRMRKIRRAASESLINSEAVILRVSSAVAGCLEPVLRRTGHPYG